jgi:molecular chaperone GrpE (heat shock protein)
VAEPKREEEKVIPIDGVRVEREADSSLPSDDSSPADPPAGTETSLAAELLRLKAEKEELLQTMIRRQADFENFRKRIERDRHEEGRRGVERIEAAGKIFDPHMHQAIERLESEEFPDGFIVAVFQDGYLFHGRVLRPAIVRVAVHPGEGEKPITYEN